MAYSIVDIAYQNMETGELVSLDWERVVSKPEVEDRTMRWDSIFPGIGLEIILGEDFIKENILLTREARERLPHPGYFNMDPKITNIVLVYAYGQEDQSGKYKIHDNKGERNPKLSFAFDGALQFERDGKVKHSFPRDEVLLPGFVDRYSTPNLRCEVQKYWHSTPDGSTVLCYGIPYLVHAQTNPGLLTIDPTIQFQDGLGGYSGAAVAVIYENAVGSVPYRTIQNFGIDPVTKLAHRASPLVNMHTLVKFDVSGLGITANNVQDAKIYMKCQQIENNQYSSQSSSLYTLKRDWNEGTKWAQNASTGEVTWGYAKYNQVAWGSGGADSSTDKESTADDSIYMTITSGKWNNWDATDSVKTWLGGTNYGAVIIPDWVDRTEGWVYHSDNASTGSDRPYLLIDLTSCDINEPYTDEDYEWLGDSHDVADGITFKKDGFSTTSWYPGDQINLEWVLSTIYKEDQYWEGQFIKLWIDLDGDCVFEENEIITLRGLLDQSNPFVIEESFVNSYSCDGGSLVANYDLPSFDGINHFTFTYKFTVPDIPFIGKFTTKARILLRFALHPLDDPTADYDTDYYDYIGTNCWSPFGDCEDYDVIITCE